LGHPVRLILVSLGLLLIVVGVLAPHGFLSIGEILAGAVLIGCSLLPFISARKKGVALKDLPWIKAAKTGGDTDKSKSGV
jgi:hypothetical protein